MSFVKRYIERRSKEDPGFKKLYEEELQKWIEVEQFVESDGSITLSTVDMDIAVNDYDKIKVYYKLAEELYEYALDYEKEFELYFNAPNRTKHVKQIMGILECSSVEEIQYLIVPKKQ